MSLPTTEGSVKLEGGGIIAHARSLETEEVLVTLLEAKIYSICPGEYHRVEFRFS